MTACGGGRRQRLSWNWRRYGTPLSWLFLDLAHGLVKTQLSWARRVHAPDLMQGSEHVLRAPSGMGITISVAGSAAYAAI